MKGILFDKDGTLIEFEHVWHNIIERILDALETRFQITIDLIEKIKEVSGYQENSFSKESIIQYCATSNIVEIWYALIVEWDQANNISYNELKNLFEEKALEDDIEYFAIEGAKELLEYLKDKGYVLGVATADTLNSTLYSLKRAKILHYFDYIGCNKDGIVPKPSSDMADRFCSEHNLRNNEVLIVGDSVTDMLFAQNAGAKFAGIKTPYNDCEEFCKQGQITVDKLKDIINRFEL